MVFIFMHLQMHRQMLGLGGDLVSHFQTHEERLFPDQILLVPLAPSPSSTKKRGLLPLIGELEREVGLQVSVPYSLLRTTTH